ncbi:MAG: hypothetical protein LAN59_14470 [Acidobacteriia bacterium]|nr:hypothetical protein [Terriglobia bacterium]
MRMNWRAFLAIMVLAGVGLATTPAAVAQDSQFLMPEQSAAKAKELLQQAIDALGGPAYLNVHDVTCTGRLGSFDHSGELTGFGKFIDFAEPPMRERQENLPKRNIVEIYDGDKGWTLDRGGVSNAPKADLAEFQETVQRDIDNILRHRIHEPDMVLRYAGRDTVDLRPVEWVELVDGGNRTIRIAFSATSHLPVRKTVEARDPKLRMTMEEVEYYSNYHPVGGIQTAFQNTRKKNGMKVFQVFFDKCDYNTGLSDSLFTRQSLDERWSKVGKKEREKEKNKKEKADKDRKDRDDTDDRN